jgi:alpha-1,2-rhamnosyltransferase
MAEDVRPVRRIWVECTRTWYRGGNTGIQRVVRNVVRESAYAARNRGMECRPLVWAGFGPVEPRRAPGLRGHWTSDVVGYLMNAFEALGEFVAELIPERLRRRRRGRLQWLRRRLARLRARLSPPVERAIVWISGLFAFPGALLMGRRAQLAPGDVLLLIDAGWGVPGFADLLRHARERGARIGVVFYDLIPIEHPAVCSPMTRKFGVYLDLVLENADFAVAISRTTRDRLSRLARGRAGRELPTGVFRLGAELDLVQEGEVGERLEPILDATGPVFLTVGSIEPRKNHGLVLDAFESLWERGIDATWVVTGRRAFRSEYVVERMRLHPELGRRLFLFEYLTDAELTRLHERAAGTICASFAEGFGLPVVESLARGVPVFASDIPVHREIGDKHCVYFDRRSATALREALEAYLDGGKLPPDVAPPDTFRWPDWWASTVELLDEIERLATTDVREPASP